ncbi:MAG TPA: hypothetical protein VFB37_04910 [Steroidobacteraceae bacterium]|nr:hypothetical protein [Steroidobacteraceae bacterium]
MALNLSELTKERREEVQADMRKTGTFQQAWLWLAVFFCAGACLLSACGNADNPKSATSSYNAKARKAQKPVHSTKPGEEDLTEMVAAVSATKAGPPVEMRFALQQSPQVGQPVAVSIALVTSAPALDSVSASFQASDGLDIVEGAESPRVDRPVPGTPLRHVLRIVPKRDGIFAVTAVVTVDSSNQHSTRTFLIPVIAGEGLSEPAKSAEGSSTPPARPPDATKG